MICDLDPSRQHPVAERVRLPCGGHVPHAPRGSAAGAICQFCRRDVGPSHWPDGQHSVEGEVHAAPCTPDIQVSSAVSWLAGWCVGSEMGEEAGRWIYKQGRCDLTSFGNACFCRFYGLIAMHLYVLNSLTLSLETCKQTYIEELESRGCAFNSPLTLC